VNARRGAASFLARHFFQSVSQRFSGAADGEQGAFLVGVNVAHRGEGEGAGAREGVEDAGDSVFVGCVCPGEGPNRSSAARLGPSRPVVRGNNYDLSRMAKANEHGKAALILLAEYFVGQILPLEVVVLSFVPAMCWAYPSVRDHVLSRAKAYLPISVIACLLVIGVGQWWRRNHAVPPFPSVDAIADGVARKLAPFLDRGHADGTQPGVTPQVAPTPQPIPATPPQVKENALTYPNRVDEPNPISDQPEGTKQSSPQVQTRDEHQSTAALSSAAPPPSPDDCPPVKKQQLVSARERLEGQLAQAQRTRRGFERDGKQSDADAYWGWVGLQPYNIINGVDQRAGGAYRALVGGNKESAVERWSEILAYLNALVAEWQSCEAMML
jgi:hypothetical protein